MACLCFNLLWYLKKSTNMSPLCKIINRQGPRFHRQCPRAREADRYLRRRAARVTYNCRLRNLPRNTLSRHQARPNWCKLEWGLRVRVCAAPRWSSRWRTYSLNISRSLNLSNRGGRLWGYGLSQLGQPRGIYLELHRLLRTTLPKG